jgi:hypothetical protein
MAVTCAHVAARASAIALSLLAASTSSCSRDAAPSRQPSPVFESEAPPQEVGAFGRAVRLSDAPPMVSDDTVREAEICASLRDAAVSVHDVPGGVVIALRPTELVSWDSLQRGADKLERALSPSARVVTAVGSARRCDLRDVAEHRVRARVERSRAEIRVHLITRDSKDVDSLRSDAREFADELRYSTPLEPPL